MTTASDILDARARVLARPVATDVELADDDVLTLLVIVAGEERFGIPVGQVATVVRPTQVMPLPRARFPVHGVTAWRGRPLTAFWLSTQLPTRTEESRFVVLGDERRAEIALLADFVEDVRSIARSSLAAVAGAVSALPTLGITSDAVLVLDPVALLRSRSAGPAAFPDRKRTS